MSQTSPRTPPAAIWPRDENQESHIGASNHEKPPPHLKMRENLSLIGDICSILGFAITLLVFANLRNIYRRFLIQARLPELRRKIRGHRSALSKLLTNYSSAGREIDAEIQRCTATLRSLEAKLGRKEALTVAATISLTSQFTGTPSPPEKDRVWDVYLALVLLEGELENLSEDMKWGPRE